jgi:hypothetical protein
MGASLHVRPHPEAPNRRDAAGFDAIRSGPRSGPSSAGPRDDQSATRSESSGGAVSVQADSLPNLARLNIASLATVEARITTGSDSNAPV